jgi:hypothetical protein
MGTDRIIWVKGDIRVMEEKTIVVIVLVIAALLLQLGGFYFGVGKDTLPIITIVVSGIIGYYFGKSNSNSKQ